HVPPNDPDSNFRMAWNAFLMTIGAPWENLHRVPSELSDARVAASEYERMLRDHFRDRRRPDFDLVLLGIGGDGHTASLFPQTSALREHRRWVVANFVPALRTWRITL